MNVSKDKPKRRPRKTTVELMVWQAADVVEQIERLKLSAENLLAMCQRQRREGR